MALFVKRPSPLLVEPSSPEGYDPLPDLLCKRRQPSALQHPAPQGNGLMLWLTLQRQPQHQAIALGSGGLESRWLTTLTEQVGQGIISFWRGWLDQQGRRTLDEQGHLVDCLKQRRMEAWL